MIDVVADLAGFARLLRVAGLTVEAPRITTALRALAAYQPLRAEDVYWATRLAFCARHDDYPAFDRAYEEWFGRPAAAIAAPPADVSRQAAALAGEGTPADAGDRRTAVRAGSAERLSQPRGWTLGAADRAEMATYMAALAGVPPRRRTSRHTSGGRREIDVVPTIRVMMRHAGEPAGLRYRTRREQRRRLVLLLDLSKSMREHRRMLLRFAFAAVAVAPTTTEVFSVGTRLDRITAELRRRDPQAAVDALSGRLLDWDAGTRLSDAVTEFTRSWGERRTVRAANVVLVSDGWELGDPTPFAGQIARLARLAHRVYWLDPSTGEAGYAPEAPPLVSSLRHVRLLAGDDPPALCTAAGVLACPSCGPRCRVHRDVRSWVAA
ncbi:hypothetical protein DMB66_04645 [Actinoplanes sp. ATCC 53533]|uniref:VWA domain-containing protein n=1 Tax=Actinoplanes sp. ATCC 53533 TaxID=1288362 RepID=UPI000F795B2E|nr:VWA domain-containing protein [Actinoplanes sp. ATCC 53533]RSM72678.1 hypothetical protein DMB66_04645 [Actinoplanes sp. ATCC 53533]